VVLILEITNLKNEVPWLLSTPHYCGKFFKFTIFFASYAYLFMIRHAVSMRNFALLSLSNIGLHKFMTLMVFHALFIDISHEFIAGSNAGVEIK